ncbi:MULTISPECIES: hypothetical protein [unclassified Cryobacterium]|uniref:hypothetical protein n=1 Tax=unclassified Cryobacterium TaxID=2649013 RepID=UPI002AB48BED|nr:MULTISPECIES: hypothetical protein [unclassified Cryobacterium]MDY7542587.1 hypothetical protein [Cryobacterium sp. 5B3]MEB0264707.1 hypothetical protein [Cryobacterium sp. 10I5]MEB0273679.1 hypothetical protein [Cryobacterium sp. 5B3]
MAGTKFRTVYFYEPIIVDQNEKVQLVPATFWTDLHNLVLGMTPEDRQITFFGRDIEGEARAETRPSTDYFYLDRRRSGQDWPDAVGTDGELGTLASKGVVVSLHEPAYLLPVSGTRYIAMMRSSAGPTSSAVARWLNLVLGFETVGDHLELQAVTRTDQLARLGKAQAATKVHLKILPGAMQSEEPVGKLGKALKEAQSVSYGSVSVDLMISYGNVQPDDAGGQELVRDVRELLNASTTFRKAKATVILENEAGELEKDEIDFKRDRITIRQQIGTDEDEEPTPTVVLDAMFEAIRAFRLEL